MTLLEISGLKTHYTTEVGDAKATNDVSLSVEKGETLGLVGESGSGKTTLAKSIMNLLPDNGRIVEGSIQYKGEELTEMSKQEFRNQIRWQEIAMIPQNAMNSLNPVYTIGSQIVEAIRTHEPETTEKEAMERARELFDRVGIDPDRVTDYPHQFSGGMAQRAMIALALSLEPALLLADEPTTALDVVIQDRILSTIKELQEEIGSAMILVTHDISVVSEICDRIAVCYGGRIVECGKTETIINNPRHPYTLGLKNAFPDISSDDQSLISIPGNPPNLVDPDAECLFAPRCPFSVNECWEGFPESNQYDAGHRVECIRSDEIDEIGPQAHEKETWQESESRTADYGDMRENR